MARRKKSGEPELFIEQSGQLRITDKSAEQQTLEKRRVECLGMVFESDDARRAYFLEKLQEKLKDPEFRKIDGFPIGKDEDILALSDPPYYTACPNPFLGDFVRHHNRFRDPSLYYHRNPHALDLSGAKNDAVYNAHAYHTKVPPAAIEELILHYTEPGDMIFDPFAGSGMTGIAAARTGRTAVLADLSPAANCIADGYVHTAIPLAINNRCGEILKSVSDRWGWLYQTKHTGRDASIREPLQRINVAVSSSPKWGEIQFVVWSDVFVCPECGADIVYWEAAVDFEEKNARQDFACPKCSVAVGKRNIERRRETVFDPSLGEPRQKAFRKPVLINYLFGKRRYEKLPDDHDLFVLARARELRHIPYPPTPMLYRDGRWGDQWRDGYHADVTHAHDFLFERSSIVLSAVWDSVRDNRDLRFWFTSTLPWCTRENRLHLGNYFGKKGGVITSLRGTLYFASLMVETNPIARFKLRASSASVPRLDGGTKVAITTQSASQMRQLPDSCLDYCFVDPPFGDNLMYSELNFQWESWLRVFTCQRQEAVVSKTQGKGLPEYTGLMRAAFSEVYRALKPGHWMTVEFHNSRNGVWMAIQEALQSVGFVVADVRILDKGKGSFNAVVAAGAVNKDLMISAYKPNGGLEDRFKLTAGTEDGAWDFIRTHFAQLPTFVSRGGLAEVIAERQGYLLFDRMVAFHVQRGVTVPLSAAEFYAGLAQRFSERDGMYFLPEQVAEYDKKRMTAQEVLQLQLLVTDETSAIQWLKQQLTAKPQSFQDLHPQFLKEIGGWQKHEKPLELSELLEQNFLRYDGKGEVPSPIHGHLSTNFKELRKLPKDDESLRIKAKDRWYVPDPNKAGDLEKLRERALLREFEEYLPALSLPRQAGREPRQKQLKVFRLEAVRAGFKRAWQDRDYAIIIAVAKKIPENVLQEDPKLLMWYDQAVTRTGEER
jgi:16S rRNA G966 N2-methylase RsmD